jgi:hypothetical protein
MVALRTIDGLPGNRSTARTHRGAVVPVGTVNSCVSSIRSAATVNSGSRSVTFGSPSAHSFFNVTGTTASGGSPCGLPPIAHVRMMSTSRAVSAFACLSSPKPASAFQGGM